MEYLNKISVNKIYSFVKKNYNSNKISVKNKDNCVLDPLSVMIKLAILYFKADGTKISIQNNTIVFQNPDIIQGVNRYFNNDKSIDITKLYIPILKCLARYEKNDDYIFLFKITIDGLEKLKKNYSIESNSNSSTITTINSYITLIKSYINGVKLDIENIYMNNTEVNNIWKKEDIELIVNYFKKLIEEENSIILTKKYIDVINNIAELKENIATELVNKAVELF